MAAPNSQTTTVNVGGGSPELVGTSASSLVAFYGATAIVQPTSANEAAVVTTVPSSTQVAFTLTSAQQISIITLVNQLRTDLVALGLIKGS